MYNLFIRLTVLNELATRMERKKNRLIFDKIVLDLKEDRIANIIFKVIIISISKIRKNAAVTIK